MNVDTQNVSEEVSYFPNGNSDENFETVVMRVMKEAGEGRPGHFFVVDDDNLFGFPFSPHEVVEICDFTGQAVPFKQFTSAATSEKEIQSFLTSVLRDEYSLGSGVVFSKERESPPDVDIRKSFISLIDFSDGKIEYEQMSLALQSLIVMCFDRDIDGLYVARCKS